MMKLTATQIRCLLAVYALAYPEADGPEREVASKDVARLLGVSGPSVHRALDILIREGLLEKEHYGAPCLTQLGRETAEQCAAYKENLMRVFTNQFGLVGEEGGAAAILLMSGLTEESLHKIETCAGQR